MPKLVVIGAGGFGREVVDVIEAINAHRGEIELECLGFLDDGAPDGALLYPYGLRHLGGVDLLAELDPDVGYVIGIGSPRLRRSIDEQWHGSRPSPVLVHPTAVVGRQVELGPGTVICSHVSITNHIRLGRHVHVNLNCTIGHDAELGDYVTLSPMVAISGAVHAHPGSFFGTGARVNPGLAIGRDAVVGTGAAVVKSVDPETTVVGVPAKPRG